MLRNMFPATHRI